mgnify:CR=1 FL=1
MTLRTDYPFDEALYDINDFINRRINNKNTKRELMDYLGKCRKGKIVSFRYIYEQYIKYTNDYTDFSPLSDDDKDMIDDLFHFWG